MPKAVPGLVAAALVLAAGCPSPIRVKWAPPPVPVEVAPPAPGPNFVWIAGYWMWDREREVWRWQRGFHARRPGRAKSYVAGRWKRRGLYWVWTPGKWVF